MAWLETLGQHCTVMDSPMLLSALTQLAQYQSPACPSFMSGTPFPVPVHQVCISFGTPAFLIRGSYRNLCHLPPLGFACLAILPMSPDLKALGHAILREGARS